MWTIREDGVVPGDDPLLLLLAVHDHDGILVVAFRSCLLETIVVLEKHCIANLEFPGL